MSHEASRPSSVWSDNSGAGSASNDESSRPSALLKFPRALCTAVAPEALTASGASRWAKLAVN